MVRLESVRKRYDEASASFTLGPLDLEAAEGTVTVLIGPSGCGKSTVLRLLVGLLLPDAGAVRIAGVVLAPSNVHELRRRIGYVIQDGGLFPHLTARENVVLMATRLGWPRERIATRVAQLATLTAFPPDALLRYPNELSGGQRQRVALMRALMLDPDILLLDEPLGALDPLIRFDLQQDLRRVFRELGKTVVLVTHDLAEAAYFGDRIVLLRDGAIVQTGTLDELLRKPTDAFVTRFVTAQRARLTEDTR